jgi:hypothetical protein
MRLSLGFAAALLCLPLCTATQADPVRRANLLDLTEFAHVIVSGRVVGVADRVEDQLPVRVVSLRVTDVLKAGDRRRARPQAGRVYQFKQYNHPALRRTHMQMPGYAPDEEVVLFLAGTSQYGLTSPLALDQGKFTVFSVGEGNRKSRLIRNARDNANLAVVAPDQPAKPAARAAAVQAQLRRVRSVALNPAEREVLTRESWGPLDYDLFVKLVKKLARADRQER